MNKDQNVVELEAFASSSMILLQVERTELYPTLWEVLVKYLIASQTKEMLNANKCDPLIQFCAYWISIQEK